MIDRLAIYLLLAGCLIFGTTVVIELQPATDDELAVSAGAAQPRDAAAVAPRQPSTRLDELLTTVLARPLFSSTRRPPQSAANDGPVNADLGDTRLTGILTEPGHHLAIFAVNGGRSLRLSEGEDVSGWRIESITPREVSLSGPGGTKTLEPKVDPNLVPAPQPTPGVNPASRQPPVAAVAPPRPGVPPTGLVPPRPGVPPTGLVPPRPPRLGSRS
jgi:general secretion pathway protein N